MGKRGPRPSELKLRLIWNLLAAGWKTPRAIEFSGLARQTAYDYINILVAEGALRKVGKSPAVFEPLPAGFKYKSEVGQNSVQGNNSVQVLNNSGKPAYGGGRDTPSRASPVATPPSSDIKDSVDKAPSRPAAGPEPAGEQEQARAREAGPEAQAGPTAGPEAPAQPQPAQAGPPAPEAPDGPHDEDVRPAPPVPLDHPARVHHRVVKVAIVKPARCRPVLDLLQWGPMVLDSHGREWYKQAEVLFDDIGVVQLMEFPGRRIRFWLPEYTAPDRRALAACVDDAVHQAQRIVNWLQRNYGYELGLPEFQDTEVAFPLPDIGGSFQGYIRIRADDGTTIVIDQSKGWAELEILIRASHKSEDLRKLLAWANAPTLLTALQGQVLELQQRLPYEVRAGARAAITAALPDIIGAVRTAIIPEMIQAIQASLRAVEFQAELQQQVRKAINESMQYTPLPAGPGDNVGYG